MNKKNSHKSQGEQANPKSLGDRGVGSDYANAVGSALDKSKHIKGSQTGFLGQEKLTLDPKDHCHSLIDKKK